MPWSGSELLQCLLAQHPEVYASSTSPLLEYHFAARSNFTLPEVKSQNPAVMEAAFLSMCEGMAQTYYKPITDLPYVVDKNRGWSHYYEWIDQWNPNPKILCMVRDLRDVLAHPERVFRKNRHSPETPENLQQLQNLTLEDRLQHWAGGFPLGISTQRLRDNFTRNVAQHLFFIRYEDLCTDPEGTMNQVWDYLGLQAPTHDFNNIEKTVQEDSSHFGVFGDHDVKSTIRPYTPGGWADVLPGDIARNIVESNQWFYQQFNY